MGSTSPLLVITVSLAAPFSLALTLLLPFSFPLSPMSSLSGMFFLDSRAFCSAQARSLTRFRSRASLWAPWFCKIASLTLVAMSLRKSGCRRGASEGARFSDGKIRRDNVLSRSLRNWGLVGARGASWDVANSNAGLISPSDEDEQERINSTNCKRSRAKCNDGFSSRIYANISQHNNSINQHEWRAWWI